MVWLRLRQENIQPYKQSDITIYIIWEWDGDFLMMFA